MINTPLVFLDLETTGLSPNNDRIIEIYMTKYLDGVHQGEYESLIDPERTISSKITSITGITNEDILNKPKMQDIIQNIFEFIGNNSVIIGHNITFDYNFLNSATNRHLNKSLQNKTVCTLKLARRILELPSNKLKLVADHLGVGAENYHRAKDDVIVCKDIFNKFVTDYLNWTDIETYIEFQEKSKNICRNILYSNK